MAATEYGVNHPLAVKHWATDLMKEALKRTSHAQFIGKTSNALCQVKTQLEKSAGDKVTFGIRYQLQGDGVEGDNVLEGNEEALITYADSVLINQTRHAVRSDGKMSEQRVPFSVRAEARDGLADWFANVMDHAFFNQLAGNTAENRSSFYGHNTVTAPDSDHHLIVSHDAETSLTSTSILTLDYIDYLREKAETAKVPLRPIDMGGGRKKYVLFIHPYQATQLRTNTNTGQWLDIQKAAMSGGQVTKNPIFTGALGEYNDTILHVNTRMPSVVANTRRAVFCGAQAMACAYGSGSGGSMPYRWNEELFDYGNQLGVAAAAIWGMKRTMFNSSAIGTITLSTYAVANA